MPTALLDAPQDLASSWRADAGADNPAGPLFSSRYTEAELTTYGPLATMVSICSGSHTIDCC